VFHVYFVKVGPNLMGQEPGRLGPPMGIISTTRPVVVSQREVDMKCCTRTGQAHVEDASLLFETFGGAQRHIRRDHSIGSVEDVDSLPLEALG
jgi:hypothetical protein